MLGSEMQGTWQPSAVPQSRRAGDFDRRLLLCLNTTDVRCVTRQLVLAGYPRPLTRSCLQGLNAFGNQLVLRRLCCSQWPWADCDRQQLPATSSKAQSSKHGNLCWASVRGVNANVCGGLVGLASDRLILCWRRVCQVVECKCSGFSSWLKSRCYGKVVNKLIFLK